MCGIVVVPCFGLFALASASESPAAIAKPESAAAASFYGARFQKTPTVPAMTAIGRAMFFDPLLSASGKQSCASCHDPRYAYGPPNDAAVQPGGSDMKKMGTRAVPSLRYAQNIPAFSEHYFDESKDESADQGPTGGRTWDGRAASAHEQAELPLLSPLEMANRDMADVVARVQQAPYAAQIRDTFGDKVFDDPRLASTAILQSLEVFQQSPPDFYPYSSKYDDYMRNKAQLSEQEKRGLALFDDANKGNCAFCHQSHITHGAFPQFTDYGYVAVGVPRNPTIPANRDSAYFDLGLCGPLRTDLKDHPEYCGYFRAPTLRNVALRRSFFHNGVFHSLEETLRFYAQRDTNPEQWYPQKPDGSVDAFNDLPPQYRSNVSRDPPFNRKPGDKPALTAAEIGDIIAFLNTLTDKDGATPVASAGSH
jgi:cytochrome c peroxidase